MRRLGVKVIAILLCAVVLGGLNFWLNPRLADAAKLEQAIAWAQPLEIEPSVAAGFGAVLWVDARSADLFDAGHIEGAVNLAPDRFDDQLEAFLMKWEPEQNVIVYCGAQDCRASSEVAVRLRQALGVEEGGNIYVLKGGWEAWRQWRSKQEN